MKFDIKFHIVALFAAMLVLDVQAVSVSSAQVRRAVSAWADANGSAFANPGSVMEVEAVSENGTNLYWIAKMSGGGAVIASPDTDLDLVVAVLEKYDGSFPAGHPLPQILRADMLNRLSVVRSGAPAAGAAAGGSGMRTASVLSTPAQPAPSAELPEDVKSSIKSANAQWAKYGSVRTGVSLLSDTLEGGDDSPYVRHIVDGFEEGGRCTHWNQGGGPGGITLYNMYTPGNVVCGCVATAASAVMQFFGCTNDIGEVEGKGCSYKGESWDCTTLPGALDWSLLPADGSAAVYECVATNEVARELIGRVAYNMGVLVGMGWAPGGSGAVTVKLADVFKEYGFTTARAVGFGEGGEGTAKYFKTIYAQTWANAPVIMSIRSAAGGHAVVACGYAKDPDGDEFCRVFMGWGGSGDAWYKFPEIGSFDILSAAVTMIGLDDDAVVPVVGYSVLPSAEFQILAAGEPVATVSANADGYFATRIPASLEGGVLHIRHNTTGKAQEIYPYYSSVIMDEKAALPDLEGALPDEILFLGLNMVNKPTMSAARAKAREMSDDNALADPRKPPVAMLVLSGSGGTRDRMLIDLISHLDSTTDMSNKFVFVHVNSVSALTTSDGDGDPSIGIFDPYSSSDELFWWDKNGRLAYSNFIDYDSDNMSGDIQYVFDENNAVALTNTVLALSDSGYDSYLRSQSGIKVSVKALDADGAVLDGLAGVEKPYGVHANCWTNGEIAVFSAPGICTNESLGVAYKCRGWTTNDVAGCVETNRCEISLAFDDSVNFSWVWDVQAYRIRGSSFPAVEGAVDPAEAWRVPGDRVTLVASPSVENGNYGFKYWTAITAKSVEVDDLSELQIKPISENGNSLSFTVNEPLELRAEYGKGVKPASLPDTTNVVVVSVNNRDLEDKIAELGGGLSLGENSTFDGFASVAGLTSSDIVDATGGVWRCTGYVVNGVTNSVPQTEPLKLDAQATALELVWELQAPEANLPEPGEISIKSIAQVDGKWVVTVSGAVKDCWYWLYSSDDLSKLAGESSQWTAQLSGVEGPNPQQATEDGDIVFTVTSGEGRMFWRAKVTATESGDK